MNWNRLLSLVVALVYLTLAVIAGGGETALKTILFLILPMAGIWFGADLGAYTGFLARRPITRRSSGGAVTFACWVLLLAPIIGLAITKVT